MVNTAVAMPIYTGFENTKLNASDIVVFKLVTDLICILYIKKYI